MGVRLQVREFIRSAQPYPQEGDIKLGAPVPGVPDPSHGGDLRVSHYSPAHLGQGIAIMNNTYPTNDDLKNAMNFDYTDERGQPRKMVGLGATTRPAFSTRQGVRFVSYASDTIGDGRGTDYFALAVGSNPKNPAETSALGFRNQAFTGDMSIPGQFVTGVTGFVMPNDELRRRFGATSEIDLVMKLNLRQFPYSGGTPKSARGGVMVHGMNAVVHVVPHATQPEHSLVIFSNIRPEGSAGEGQPFRHQLVPVANGVWDAVKDQGVNSADLYGVSFERAHDYYQAAIAQISALTGFLG